MILPFTNTGIIMSVDFELIKKFLLNDPRAYVLPSEIYNQVLSQPMPLQAFADTLSQVKKKMTVEQRKAACLRAKDLRDFAEVAIKVLTSSV
jgi:hypothetical protein